MCGNIECYPDSFSDGGKHNKPKEAVEHALRMIEEGADIIDVGSPETQLHNDFRGKRCREYFHY